MSGRSVLGWILEAIALVCLFAMFVYIAIHWNDLPNHVPPHVVPRHVGAKTGLLILPCLALVLYILLTIQSRFPGSMKLRFGIDRNDPAVVRIITEMLSMVKVIVVVTFAYILWVSIQLALGRTQGLGVAFMPFAVGAATLVPLLYLLKLRRYRKQ
jgi:hypothetical protein